jgi:putative flippase GtrA
LRFAVVGAIGAVVDFGTFNLVNHLPHARRVGQRFSFAAVMSNFLWNRFWTYPDSRSKKVPGKLPVYLVSVYWPGHPHAAVCLAGKVLIRSLRRMLPKNFFFSSTFYGA